MYREPTIILYNLSKLSVKKSTAVVNFFNLNNIFLNFFIVQQVDIPVILLKTPSRYRTPYSLIFLKLYKKFNASKHSYFFSSILYNYMKHFSSYIFKKEAAFSNSKLPLHKIHSKVSWYYKYFDNNNNIPLYLNYILNNINLIFTFKIFKIDKRIRKHSRKKSGKYEIKWLYTPEYKRHLFSIYWLKKLILAQPYKHYFLKIWSIFKTLAIKPKNHFLIKLNKYLRAYVFRRYKAKLDAVLLYC